MLYHVNTDINTISEHNRKKMVDESIFLKKYTYDQHIPLSPIHEETCGSSGTYTKLVFSKKVNKIKMS